MASIQEQEMGQRLGQQIPLEEEIQNRVRLNRISRVSTSGTLAILAIGVVSALTQLQTVPYEQFFPCAHYFAAEQLYTLCHAIGIDQFRRIDTEFNVTLFSLAAFYLNEHTFAKWAEKVNKVNNHSLTQPENTIITPN